MYAGTEADQQPEPGFLTRMVQGFLATAQGQAVQRDVSGALAPFAQGAAQQAAATWMEKYKVPLLVGGGLVVVLLVRRLR